MKRLFRLCLRYYILSLAVLVALVSGGLRLSGKQHDAHYILETAAILGVFQLLWSMLHNFRNGSYNQNILGVSAIITSVLLHQDWTAIALLIMLASASLFEDYATHYAKNELRQLIAAVPSTAHVIRSRKTIEVAAQDVRTDEKVIIHPGETVPVDVIILEGSGTIDESWLSGDRVVVTRGSGDFVPSGSINVDSVITARSRATADESQYQQMIKRVRAASDSQAPFMRLARSYNIPFTLLAFAIAGAVWALSGHALRFLEVLVVATPLPLFLSAPLTFTSGIIRASSQGIIIKTGAALERLSNAKTIVFAKTGILTEGNLKLEKVTTYRKYATDDALALASGIAQASSHQTAATLVAVAQKKKVRPYKVKGLREISGQGCIGDYKGARLILGRLSLLEENGVIIPAELKKSALAATTVYLAVDLNVVASFAFGDKPREHSQITLDTLRDMGYGHIAVLTGDNESAAAAIATPLRITEVYSDAVPAEKLRYLEEMKRRPIVFVGDGINDTSMITVANIGIALGAYRSTVAGESADIIIMQPDITRVASAVFVAYRTISIAKQSIFFGLGTSFLFMLAFATGKIQPFYGVLLQGLIVVIVLLSALRVHRLKIPILS